MIKLLSSSTTEPQAEGAITGGALTTSFPQLVEEPQRDAKLRHDFNPNLGNQEQQGKDGLPTFRKLKYPETECASCNAPLDTSEFILNLETAQVYCTENKDSTHLCVRCVDVGCGKKFSGLTELKIHADSWYHRAFQCATLGCSERLLHRDLGEHLRYQHLLPLPHDCAECGEAFENQHKLDDHGRRTLHAAYICQFQDCGAEVSRVGDLKRHQLTHKEVVQRYPCRYCRKYRGNNGFKRKDHLSQHIRNYHHIGDTIDAPDPDPDQQLQYPCNFKNCDKVGESAFQTEKALKSHLKHEHPSPFQCPHRGCDRVGTNGWMRKSDMVKHVKKFHADANEE